MKRRNIDTFMKTTVTARASLLVAAAALAAKLLFPTACEGLTRKTARLFAPEPVYGVLETMGGNLASVGLRDAIVCAFDGAHTEVYSVGRIG